MKNSDSQAEKLQLIVYEILSHYTSSEQLQYQIEKYKDEHHAICEWLELWSNLEEVNSHFFADEALEFKCSIHDNAEIIQDIKTGTIWKLKNRNDLPVSPLVILIDMSIDEYAVVMSLSLRTGLAGYDDLILGPNDTHPQLCIQPWNESIIANKELDVCLGYLDEEEMEHLAELIDYKHPDYMRGEPLSQNDPRYLYRETEKLRFLPYGVEDILTVFRLTKISSSGDINVVHVNNGFKGKYRATQSHSILSLDPDVLLLEGLNCLLEFSLHGNNLVEEATASFSLSLMNLNRTGIPSFYLRIFDENNVAILEGYRNWTAHKIINLPSGRYSVHCAYLNSQCLFNLVLKAPAEMLKLAASQSDLHMADYDKQQSQYLFFPKHSVYRIVDTPQFIDKSELFLDCTVNDENVNLLVVTHCGSEHPSPIYALDSVKVFDGDKVIGGFAGGKATIKKSRTIALKCCITEHPITIIPVESTDI